MAVRPIDAMELKQRMCALCNQDYSDEPCEPSDCVFVRAINEAPTLTPQNEWVSVEESNKPKRGELIVYADSTAWGFRYGVCRVHGAETNFTYWMPLPEPPYCRPPEGEEGDADRG